MKIFDYITSKKNQFKDLKNRNEIARIERENHELELEKQRQLKLKEINQKKSNLKSEVEPMREYNNSVRGDGMIEKMGKALAKATNEQPKSALFNNQSLTEGKIKERGDAGGLNFSEYKGPLSNQKIKGIKFK